MRNVLTHSRYLVLLAVIGIMIASIVAFAYALIATVQVVYHAFARAGFNHLGAKRYSVEVTELIDLFLLGTVLYIIAMGLYQLFIDESLKLPHWLRVDSLEDLKIRLIGVTVVLLGVSFLGEVVEWEGGNDIMFLGIGIAVVMLAFAPVLYLHHRHHSPAHPKDDGV